MIKGKGQLDSSSAVADETHHIRVGSVGDSVVGESKSKLGHRDRKLNTSLFAGSTHLPLPPGASVAVTPLKLPTITVNVADSSARSVGSTTYQTPSGLREDGFSFMGDSVFDPESASRRDPPSTSRIDPAPTTGRKHKRNLSTALLQKIMNTPRRSAAGDLSQRQEAKDRPQSGKERDQQSVAPKASPKSVQVPDLDGMDMVRYFFDISDKRFWESYQERGAASPSSARHEEPVFVHRDPTEIFYKGYDEAAFRGIYEICDQLGSRFIASCILLDKPLEAFTRSMFDSLFEVSADENPEDVYNYYSRIIYDVRMYLYGGDSAFFANLSRAGEKVEQEIAEAEAIRKALEEKEAKQKEREEKQKREAEATAAPADEKQPLSVSVSLVGSIPASHEQTAHADPTPSARGDGVGRAHQRWKSLQLVIRAFMGGNTPRIDTHLSPRTSSRNSNPEGKAEDVRAATPSHIRLQNAWEKLLEERRLREREISKRSKAIDEKLRIKTQQQQQARLDFAETAGQRVAEAALSVALTVVANGIHAGSRAGDVVQSASTTEPTESAQSQTSVVTFHTQPTSSHTPEQSGTHQNGHDHKKLPTTYLVATSLSKAIHDEKGAADEKAKRIAEEKVRDVLDADFEAAVAYQDRLNKKGAGQHAEHESNEEDPPVKPGPCTCVIL